MRKPSTGTSSGGAAKGAETPVNAVEPAAAQAQLDSLAAQSRGERLLGNEQRRIATGLLGLCANAPTPKLRQAARAELETSVAAMQRANRDGLMRELSAPQTIANVPTFEDGSTIPHASTYQALLDFVNSPDRYAAALQRFEREVVNEAADRALPLEEARGKLISDAEARHGFPPAVDVTSFVGGADFVAMLRSGTLFRDLYFGDLNHGADTHRIQWHLFTREVETDPELQASIGEQLRAAFQEMGNLKSQARYRWDFETDQPSLWRNLFDTFNDSPRSPNFLSRKLRSHFPLVGVWS
ncbi:MAG: LirA/MavJ family T4SS effector [Myxococcaceae bacterium]